MDVTHSLSNPYGNPSTQGATFGGYDGYVGEIVNGAWTDLSALHTRLTKPFTKADIGRGIWVGNYDGFMRLITAVDHCDSVGACSTVRWDPAQPGIHTNSTGTSDWAVSPHDGWEIVFVPTGTIAETQAKYEDATFRVHNKYNEMRVPLRFVGDHLMVSFIEVVGPNVDWREMIENYDASNPAVNEFQSLVAFDGNNNTLEAAYLHHAWGDGINMAGQHQAVLSSHIARTGRHGINGSAGSYEVRFEQNTIELNHHAILDWEGDGTNPFTGSPYFADTWVLHDNTFGGPHGISNVPRGAIGHILIEGNHSTDADVAAGTIQMLAPIQRGASWGSQDPKTSGYMIVRNNVFHAPDAGINFNKWTHVLVAGNHFNTTGCLVSWSDTAMSRSVNNTGVGSQQCGTPTGTFVPPGQPDPDTWWSSQ
jgi:hypothetical protein